MIFRKLMLAASALAASTAAVFGALPQPDENGRIAVVESVTVDDAAGAEALAAAKEIVLAEGATLSYTSPEALELSAKVSGAGVFEAVDAGLVTLSADNSGLVSPGQFVFRRTPVLVTSETGLGGGGSGEATFIGNVTNNHLRFVGTSSVFTNYAPIAMKLVSAPDTGTFYFGSQGEDKYLVQAASLTVSVDNYKTTAFYFKHNVEIIAGTFTIEKYPYIRRSGNGIVRIGENVDVVWGHSAQAIVYLSNLRLGCKSLYAKNGLSPSAANNIVFEKSNCLHPGTPLRPYANGFSGPFYDLNGYDQICSHLEQINGAQNVGSLIKSDESVLLKASGASTGSGTGRWKFTGPISYWHDTAYETTFTQYKLESTGDLTVSKGKVVFTGGSGWAGDNVTVKAGGALSCASEASLDSGEHILTVESGGVLDVAAGVTLKVRTAVIGSVTLPAGRVISMAEIRSLTEGEDVTLTGDGFIQTAAGSIVGEWKGWPEVGTAETVVIPDGTVVPLTDDDIEKVSALSHIRAGVGTRIRCSTTQVPFDLKPSLSGDLTFEALNCGTIVLSGDNSGLLSPGGFFFSNRYGLGSALSGIAHFWPAAPMSENRSILRFGGAASTNDVKLVFHYGAYIGHQDPETRFVQNNDVVQLDGNLSPPIRRFGIFNDFTLARGASMEVSCTYQDVNSHLRIEEDASLMASGNFGNGYYHIAGTVLGSLSIEQGMRRFIFERENALMVGSCIFHDGSEKKFFFDLNGFNQTLPIVKGNQYADPKNLNQQCFDVTSATPATLTLNAGPKMNSEAAIRCLDQASLTYSGASTQTIGFATSTTVGALTVNSGAIALERNAKWLSPNVTVNGGMLIVRPSAATNTFGVGRATATDLFVNGDGRLELQSGAYTSTVHSITLDGVLLRRGIYTAENCRFITGEGALRAVRGQPTSVMIVVR